MGNKGVKSPGIIERRHAAGIETDYSPKRYTLREQIVTGVKTVAIAGIFFLLLWLFEKI